MLLFYVRHGEPTYDPDQLTYLGHMQAIAIGQRLAVHGIDKIYSSTSTRAYQTAEPLAKMLRQDITQLDFCNEKHAFRDFSLVDEETDKRKWCFAIPKYARLMVSREVRNLGDAWYTHPGFPAENRFREGTERVRRETDALMKEWGYERDEERCGYRAVRKNDDRVALFAHGGFGYIFLSCLLDIPYSILSTRLDIAHTTLTVIELKEDENGLVIPRALTMSNDGHLYKETLPVNERGERF